MSVESSSAVVNERSSHYAQSHKKRRVASPDEETQHSRTGSFKETDGLDAESPPQSTQTETLRPGFSLKVAVIQAPQLRFLLPILKEWEKSAKSLFLREFMLDNEKLEERYLSVLVNIREFIKECESPRESVDKFYLICKETGGDLQGCMVLTHPWKAGSLYQDTGRLVIDRLITTPNHPNPSWAKMAEKISEISKALLNKGMQISTSDGANGLVVRSEPSTNELFLALGFRALEGKPYLLVRDS